MNHRNIGRFTVSGKMISDEINKVGNIFGIMKAVPVRCEHMFASNAFEYTAISDIFPYVPPENMVPEYTLIVETGKGGRIEAVKAMPV